VAFEVVCALAGFYIQKPACDRCIVEFFRVIITEFVQAASATAIT
jgi:hypothetical protein